MSLDVALRALSSTFVCREVPLNGSSVPIFRRILAGPQSELTNGETIKDLIVGLEQGEHQPLQGYRWTDMVDDIPGEVEAKSS